MIMWTKQQPNTTIVSLLGIENPKKATLGQALAAYSEAEGVEYPTQVKLWCKKILEYLAPNKEIEYLTVKDAQKVFVPINKNENEATANRCRATIANAVRYIATGEMPDKKPWLARNPANAVAATTPADDMGKLKFTKAKLSDVVQLVPLYSVNGRFGWFKAEVQRQVFSCAPGEVGVIEAPKRATGPKEAKAMCSAATHVLSKIATPWTIRYNPNESVFIVLRVSDFDALMKQQKGPK